jgi:hypothetical protein
MYRINMCLCIITQGTLCCPSGTVDVPCKSTVRRVAAQLHRALSEKGLALLVNHGIPEDKVRGSGTTNDVVFVGLGGRLAGMLWGGALLMSSLIVK